MLKKIPGGGPGLGANSCIDHGDSPSPTRATSKEYAETEAALDLLCAQFPKTFFRYQARRKPKKLNIDHDILLLLDGAVTYLELKRALGCYTSNFGYLKSCRAGAAVAYNAKYISWLQSLPDVEMGQPHRRKPLAFRFHGGEGMLMPCRPDPSA